MKKSLLPILGILALGAILSPAAAQEMQEVSAGTASIRLPADWRATTIPDRVIAQSSELNSMGLPAVSFNLGPDPSGRSFGELQEQNRSGAASRSKEGDEHVFEELEHEAGDAFTYVRITTTAAGQKQAMRNAYIEAGGRVWLISWTQMASDDVTAFEDLWRTVLATFRAG